MPMYKYKCDFCGHTFKELQSISEPSLTDCPECANRWKNGKTNTLHKVFDSFPGVIFKGSGFHCTDYPNENQKNTKAQKIQDMEVQSQKEKIKEHKL